MIYWTKNTSRWASNAQLRLLSEGMAFEYHVEQFYEQFCHLLPGHSGYQLTLLAI